MKGRMKRAVSGFLTAVTLISTVFQPVNIYAAERDAAKEKPPLYEEVKDQLDEDEVVTAHDLEIGVGYSLDVKADFSGIKIADRKKVKVTFEEAFNEQGETFTTDHEDTYTAVYYVEPQKTDHPKYQISRKLIVKEGAAVVQTKESAEAASGENSGDAEEESEDADPDHAEMTENIQMETGLPEENSTEPETEIHSEEELDQELEEAETQETVDSETGLSLGSVMLQAVEQGVNLLELEEGESLQFTARSVNLFSAKASQQVTVTAGEWYHYADYGLGSYLTCHYTVSFGNVKATAYCVQPSKPGPGNGTYTITRLQDGKTLAKVCYYGTKASGNEGFFAEKYPEFSAGKRFIITHLAAAYANGSSDAFSGANATGKALAMELYDYCVKQSDIPDVEMSFSNGNVKAYIEGNRQRTEEVTFRADAQQTITMKLPSGVKFHNVTTGKTSKEGESVEVSGGTKFYLSAPLTQAEDVKGSWSATMKGSITKDYSAYKITTGSGTQDLALVFGEGVDDEKYVDFKVEWVKMATVSIVKKDRRSNALIKGAVYGIYRDEAGKNLITAMPATDEKGASSITIEKTQETVYLKEISVPAGYVLDGTSYGINLVIGKPTNKVVTDKEQLADLTVYKEGEVLTGASVTENGVVFTYTKQRQKGAVYNVYAGADIKAADGTLIYKKGELVKENLTTGEDGSAVLKNLHLGTYEVTEVKAPENFVCKGESKTVTLSYSGQNVEVAVGSVSFVNERQRANVSVRKQDGLTKNPLSGGIYGLYAGEDIQDVSGKTVVPKDTLIEKVTTGADGNGAYQSELPINHSYYVKELQAPEKYYRNSEEVFTFRFDYTNDREETISFTHIFENERVNARISLVKKDKETGSTPQGDAVFEGAVYGLYAREDIVHPDGSTGVLHKAGTQVAAFNVDKEGKAEIGELYLGKYFVKEITPPAGYLLDETEYEVDCSYEGDTVKTVERNVESEEQVMKQPFQIIKAANNGDTDAALLKGAGFTAYLKSSLKEKPDGSYDFDSAEPVVIGADGATEMFTDEKGYACSIPLPYGTYIVRETTTPHNYTPVQDFTVTIHENHPDEPQVWRVLLDKEFAAKLKIIKKDDETKKPVLVAGAEFKIYDMDHKKYVEQVTTYPVTTIHKSYFTDSQGYLILPQNLKIGNYRIEEVTAPDGYTINENFVEIKVDSNTAYQMDAVSGDAVIEVSYENHPVKEKLTVYKKGEMLAGYDKDFLYEEKYLADVEFEVYAAEDIFTPDFQKDSDGNRILVYAKDSLVGVMKTGEDGKATLDNLPLGSYYVMEKTAPDGFVTDKEPSEVAFVYVDQDTPVVEQEVTIKNERQKVEITVEKQDAENEAVLSGAVFGIYNKNDILADDKVIVEAGTLLQEMTSDEKGLARCTLDLPLGKYFVKELESPVGYVTSDEILEFDASYQGQEIATVTLKAVKKNEPTAFAFTKSDITTGEELDGASLKVIDKDGNIVDEWTSEKGKPHSIKRLVVGENYILREEFAPYGYLKAEEITFTVDDTAQIQKVEMKDKVPTGLLIVNKKGEFLDKITLLDQVKGAVEHLFEYISGNLSKVTFEVYAAEDIHAADGVSEDYFKADELVGKIVTGDNGIAQMENLPAGRYYVKEVETAHGFVLDKEPRYVDLSYRDQDTPVITFQEEWQNRRQKVQVSILKKEKDGERVLAGAVFGLYTRDDIKNKDGNVLMEAESLIEQKTTDEKGQIVFRADLPVDGRYYVKELSAPEGFVATEEEQDFTFTYAGAGQEEVSYEFTFENEPTTMEFTKTDLTTGKELPGAHLCVKDKDGNMVDEWVSGEEAHVIKGLAVGKSYTMTETKPADGYVTAESITFTVENTAKVQKQEMKDDVTKVEISKQDIATGKELPGAKLTILDKNGKTVKSWTSGEKAYYMEKLPIGEYTLHEEAAPEGYLVAEDVRFTVEDTGEIQKVVMKDKKEASPEKPNEEKPEKPVPDTPKTGDDRHPLVWMFLLLLAGAGTGSSLWYLKRKKK